jgi:hypothetical protein
MTVKGMMIINFNLHALLPIFPANIRFTLLRFMMIIMYYHYIIAKKAWINGKNDAN